MTVGASFRGQEAPNNVKVSVVNHSPDGIRSYQNYPNPFNPVTTITFSVGTYSHTSLRVYDMLGREIAVLANENKSPGSYQVQWNAKGMPSGVYFYRIVRCAICTTGSRSENVRNGQAGHYRNEETYSAEIKDGFLPFIFISNAILHYY